MFVVRGSRSIIVSALGSALWMVAAQEAFARAEAASPADDAPSPATVDELNEQGYLQRTRDVPRAVEPPSVERGLWAVNVGAGLAFGGDTLYVVKYDDGSERELTAGTGGNVFLGTTLIPVRVDRYSLGLGLDFGFKGQRVEALTMTRYPLILSLYHGYKISAGLSLLVACGLQTEFGVAVSGGEERADLDIDLDNAVGAMAEAGILWEGRSLGVDLTLRYTGIEYGRSGGSDTFSASSFGVFFALHVNLLRTVVR